MLLFFEHKRELRISVLIERIECLLFVGDYLIYDTNYSFEDEFHTNIRDKVFSVEKMSLLAFSIN